MPFLRTGSKKHVITFSSHRVARGVTSRVVEDFMSALDCPRSLAIWLLWKHNEHQQLVDLDVNPYAYSTAYEARAAYLATNFLSKYEDFSLDVDKKEVAMEKFEKFELSCRRVNKEIRAQRIRNWKNSELGPLLSAMAFKIDAILGPFDAQEVFDNCEWGPGASTMISSRDASKPHKFQCEIGITRRLYDLLCPGGSMSILSGYSQRWAQRLIEEGFPLFQFGNKVVTVPKNAKTDRVIAIEPGLNIWLQKGVGAVFKRRLRKRGIDLTDQSRNQRFAHDASVDGTLATIDFSSASDSISYELVKEVFPPLWFELLDRLRCERGKQDDRLWYWEKFSSMGNGCTFEIETLIFYALACACADEDGIPIEKISVYGDDVIIPIQIVERFRRTSELLGFSFNTTKSYTTGPFRESCGAHWYGGLDFKPVYFKSRLSTVQSVFRLGNAVRRLSHRLMCYEACDGRFRRMFYRLVFLVPKPLRLRIPEGLGDGGFISNFDESSPKRSKHQIEGFDVKNVVDLSISAEADTDGMLLCRLKEVWDEPPSVLLGNPRPLPVKTWALYEVTRLKLSNRASGNKLTHRDHTRPVVMTSLAPQWYNLGPWID